MDKISSIVFGEIGNIKQALHHDKFLIPIIHNFLFNLNSRDLMLPDKSPNFFICDTERHIAIVSFTEFYMNGNAAIRMSMWHPKNKFQENRIMFEIIQNVRKAREDKSKMKLISAKIKTTMLRLSKLFADSDKLFDEFEKLRV